MQKISNFFYGVWQGILGIFRNRMFSFASICTMAACLFLFGVFYVILANFEHVVNEAEKNVGVTVFFDEGITDDEIIAIGEKILKRAEVSEVTYTSAEAAWEEYKNTKLSPELAETFGEDNPLANSASFTVYLNDIEMEQSLVKYISAISGVRKCNDVSGLAENLSSINRIIAIVTAVIITVLLFVSTFLISITVSMGVSIRKKEISIMKFIGATNGFISIPYVVEGVLIGLIGAGIPLVLFKYAYPRMITAMQEHFGSIFNMVSMLDRNAVSRVLTPVMIILGVGIGFIGSKVTLNKQLRKIDISD